MKLTSILPHTTAPTPIRPLAPMRMLFILGIMNALNFLDRQLVGILLPHIKADFVLTDSQIGLLTGVAFALFFSVAGLPLGWVATRVDRRKLIAASIAGWSVMTALSGVASSFSMLLFARVGVGIGEAGVGPSSYAMISDAFSERARPAAIAFYAAAASVGGGIGILFGGWAADVWGWRTAFYAAGCLGLVVVPIVWFQLIDPLHKERVSSPVQPLSLVTSVKFILRTKTFLPLAAAAVLTAFSTYTLLIWLPSFLVRSYQLSTASAGAILAPISLLGGVGGQLSGGMLARRLGVIDIRWWMWLPASALATSVPLAAFGIMSHRLEVTIVFLFLTVFASYMFSGPLFAALNTIVLPRIRPLANSMVVFLQAAVGLSLGPLLTGMVSDTLLLRAGADALRYALVVPIIGMAFAALFYLLAARTLRLDASQIIGAEVLSG